MNTQRHRLEWVAPQPLWPVGTVPDPAMRRPALLSFKTDKFIDELNQALAQNPPSLPVASWESARVAPAGTPRLGSPPWSPSPGSPPATMKLFQPVHGRFYLVAASFVCQQFGLPDHALNVANQERTYFVLRKLDGAGNELAWVPTSTDASNPQYGWQPVPHPRTLAPNEDLLPLFPVFVPGSRPPRRLHAGLIPTSSRDTFTLAATSSPPADPNSDPRIYEAKTRVVDPYGAIVGAHPTGKPGDQTIPMLVDASAFLMLDLAEILAKYTPALWANVLQQSNAPAMPAASAALLSLFQQASADTTANVSWAQALRFAVGAQATIDAPGSPPSTLTTPTFNLFYAAQPSPSSQNVSLAPDAGLPMPPLLAPAYYLSDVLTQAIQAENQPFDPPDAAVAAPIVPKVDTGAQFVVRCVFQRCALKRQQFGALFPPILSDPSLPFSLAAFFDSDAPARTIRIPMPFDTSPGALRKFPKGVGFLLSPQLQQQVNQVANLSNMVNGQLSNAPGLGLGEICCFSIPIISIIALILMFAIAIALNFVFWWLPFLKICLPVPASVVQAAGGGGEES
jgi:hypothetical protein